MNRIDLSFYGRPGRPIVVKNADQIIHPDMAFWRGMAVAFPIALAIWGILVLVMVL